MRMSEQDAASSAKFIVFMLLIVALAGFFSGAVWA